MYIKTGNETNSDRPPSGYERLEMQRPDQMQPGSQIDAQHRKGGGFYIDDILRKNPERKTDFRLVDRRLTDLVAFDRYDAQITRGNLTANSLHNLLRLIHVEPTDFTCRHVSIDFDEKLQPNIGDLVREEFNEGNVRYDGRKNPRADVSCCISQRSPDADEVPSDSGDSVSRFVVHSPRKFSSEECSGSRKTTSESAFNSQQSRHQSEFKLPTWVYCTRYSDRPSAGPRCRRKLNAVPGHRRERTSFTEYQLSALRAAYVRCRYLNEDSRQQLAAKLGLDVSKIKVWFQNKRASDKKTSGVTNGLALRLKADGLYDHSTRPRVR